MEWGHAVSEDLLNWEELPVALTPTPGGPDEAGCFSGCSVDNNGVPTIVYTGVTRLDPPIDFEWGGRQYRGFWANHSQCLATSRDDLVTWEKHPANPVLSKGKEAGLELTPHWHDPVVWREGEIWYMMVGTGIEGAGAAHLVYRSDDLVNWEYLKPLFSLPDDHHSSAPDFFRLGGKHVLLEARGNLYFTGTCKDLTFEADFKGRTDLSTGVLNAPKTLLDHRNRRIMLAGILENRDESAQRSAGWGGVLSLPRLLSVRSDGELGMEPVPELAALRGARRQYRALILDTTTPILLEDIRGDSLEIIAEIDPGDASEIGLRIRSSPDRGEETLVSYNPTEKRLQVDREHSSLAPNVQQHAHGGSFDLRRGESLKLHLFLDRSVVEIFANGRTCLTSRIYPTRDDSLGVGAFAKNGSATVTAMDIWELGSANG